MAGVMRPDLVGLQFPVGALRIDPYEDWLARDCIGAPAATDDLVHPGWTLFGALRGAGYDLESIIQLCGASWDDGVLFGETVVEQIEPLRHSVDYVVRGSFVEVQHRTGRKIAECDLVSYELLIEHDDQLAVRCRNSFVVPRRRS